MKNPSGISLGKEDLAVSVQDLEAGLALLSIGWEKAKVTPRPHALRRPRHLLNREIGLLQPLGE